MPVLDNNKNKIFSDLKLKEIYGKISKGRGGYKKGVLFIFKSTKVFIQCDKCDKIVQTTYNTIEKYGIENTLCNNCRGLQTQYKKYGKRFVNVEKRNKTYIKNNSRKHSEETKKRMSDVRKKYLKTKKGKKDMNRLHQIVSKSNIKRFQEGFNINNCYISGTFYSKKMNKNIYYRSSYEKHFYFLLEICNSVIKYEVEPFSIKYFFSGKCKRYLPDVLVYWENGITDLIEIKPTVFKESEQNKLKFKSAKEYIKNSKIDNFLILDFGEMFKYICQNYTVSSDVFPQYFMEELNNITSNMNINDYT